MSVNRAIAAFTLTEVLIGTVTSVIVLAALIIVYLSGMSMHRELSGVSGQTLDQLIPAAAVTHTVKRLELADRIVIPVAAPAGSVVLLRTPDYTTAPCTSGVPPGTPPGPDCLDQAPNYRWDEYHWNSGALEFYRVIRQPGGSKQCGSKQILSDGMTAVAFTFRDTGVAAVGTEPMGVLDNNVVSYTVSWQKVITAGKTTATTLTRTYAGEATSRFIPYSNINAAIGDSGQGLAPVGIPVGISDPPTDGFC